MPLRRLDITLSVAYGTDVDKVKNVVNEYVVKDERVKKEPAHFFRLTEFGASSLNFTLRVWVDASEYWSVKFDLMEGILKLFEENAIEIPFDQLDVHVRKADGEVQA